MKTKKNNLDFTSIKTVSLTYFLLFAMALVAFIWMLQIFFINNYYERMKIRETKALTESMEARYNRGIDAFDSAAMQTSFSSDVIIRVDGPMGTKIFDKGSFLFQTSSPFDPDIEKAHNRLIASNMDSASMITTSAKSHHSKLIYAKRLGEEKDETTMYVISPLYPVQTTVAIMRKQMLYIMAISLIIASIIAWLLSKRLTAPIESITKSATELTRGNYNIHFSGGNFTETQELAKTLNTASYEMQKSDTYQRDLMANVSHDLRTPLTMIKSYAEMVNDFSGDDPEKRREHIGIIISETDRLTNLVSDMLSLSRLQSNNLELRKQDFDFVAAAKEVAATYEILKDQEGFDIETSFCRKTYVNGDKEKLKQVMNNLISNAVKYSGDNKFIKIKVSRTARKVRFEVIDNGVGIPSDEISHVWEKYYRTSANRNRDIEGTGLGLSIAKGILTLHHAEYGVVSKESEGSTFWFELNSVRSPSGDDEGKGLSVKNIVRS